MPKMKKRPASAFAMLALACLAMVIMLSGCATGQGRGALTGLCEAREPFVRDHAAALADLPPSAPAQRAQYTGRVLIEATDAGCNT